MNSRIGVPEATLRAIAEKFGGIGPVDHAYSRKPRWRANLYGGAPVVDAVATYPKGVVVVIFWLIAMTFSIVWAAIAPDAPPLPRLALPAIERAAASAYKGALLVGLMCLPLLAVLYLREAQDPAAVIMAQGLHEAAILLSLVLALFVAWVCFRCHQHSGEPFQRFLALGLLGFAIVYAPHVALTHDGGHDPWLFLLYGPASRMVLTFFLLMAAAHMKAPAEAADTRLRAARWLPWLGLAAATIPLVAWLAMARPLPPPVLRNWGECLAIAMTLAALALAVRARPPGAVMWLLAAGLACFVQSSLAFLLAKPWNHMWWLAHGISAAGFLALSYGVMRAFLTTRSFATVFNEADMLARLASAEAVTEALRQSEAQMRALLATCPVGVSVTSPEGRPLFANARLVELAGPTDAEAVGRLMDAVRRQVVATGSGSADAPVEIPGNPSPRWLALSGLPATFAGQPAVVVWVRDITGRKRQEEGLRRMLDDKEVLFAELNHRVKNNLQLVSRLLSLQSRDAERTARDALDEARGRIDTLSRLHRRLHDGEYTGQMPLATALADMCADIRGALAGNAALTMQVEANGLSVPVEKAVPLLLLVNELVVNACKHAFPANGGGRVDVRLELLAEEMVRLSVADDGIGLPSDFLDRETLGVRVARAMAAQLGGELTVLPGPGTCFQVEFPNRGEAAVEAPVPWQIQPRPAGQGAAARILVVDDEELAAQCIAEFLDDRGYETAVATDGRMALAAFEAAPADLVVTDVRMMGMGGAELVRRLRERAPDLAIVVVSGQDARPLLGDQVTAFLDKPVALEELLAIIRRLLAAA